MWDVAELVLAMYSVWEKNSFSQGADVRGILFLFFWLKSGTEKQPDGDQDLEEYLFSMYIFFFIHII